MSQRIRHLFDGELEELTNKGRHGTLLDDERSHVALGHRVVLQYRHQGSFLDRASREKRWEFRDGCPRHRKVPQMQVVIAGEPRLDGEFPVAERPRGLSGRSPASARCHANTDLMASMARTAEAAGGWDNKCLLFKAFLDEVTEKSAAEIEQRWAGKLASVDVFTASHVQTALTYVRWDD